MEDGSRAFTLICKVTGNPKPTVSWNVRGTIVRKGYNNGKYQVTPQGLVIRNITQADRGAYKCKATQVDEDINDFQEMIIDLKVQRKYPISMFWHVAHVQHTQIDLNCKERADFFQKM